MITARRLIGRLPACLLLMGLAVAGEASAAGPYRPLLEVDGLRITIDAEWPARTAPGYLPVRFDITNLADARTIEILERGTRGGRAFVGGMVVGPATMRSGTMTVSREITLARGARVRFVLPVPLLAPNENLQFEIRENNKTIEHLGSMGLQSGAAVADAAALIVAVPASPLAQQAAGWLRRAPLPSGAFVPAGSPTASVLMPTFDLVLEPSRLPTSWLGYTSLRAVMIGATEWQQLNDAQRTALRTWVACGGDLLFIDAEIPDAFAPAGGPAAVLIENALPFFLGQVHRVTTADVETRSFTTVLFDLPSLRDANWALPVNRSADWNKPGTRGFRLPMDGVGTINARAYLAILVLFTVLIGPVNYVWLRGRQQQVLMVVTAPALSVLFILLLATYVIAGEGFGLHVRATSLTVLDQSRQEAATRASVSLYAAGRTPGGGLRFSRDAAVFPMAGLAESDDLRVDLSEAQRFASGLVRARTPANFETAEFRTARERLVFSRSGDGLEVLNGLGAPVRRVILYGRDQVYAFAGTLGAGGRAAMTPSRPKVTFVPPDHPLSARFDAIASGQPPGTYLAVLDRSPFWQAGAPEIIEHESVHVVVGLVEQLP